MTSSNWNIFCVTDPLSVEFTDHRWIHRTFLDLRLNKRLSKQSWGWWFETLSRSSWRPCNVWVALNGWRIHIEQDLTELFALTHWGRATHICVGKLTTIVSDNGLSPGRRQAIIWTIAGILLIWPLGTDFSEFSIGIQTFSFKKMHLKMPSAKWRPFVSASMC